MQTRTRRQRPLFSHALRPAALILTLAAGVGTILIPAHAPAAPGDLDAYRDAAERLRADPHARHVTGELASFEAWLRAATSHASYGQDDAVDRLRARLDAQRGLIEARLALARVRHETDEARNTARALDRQIADARTNVTLLERHNARTQQRGQ